jgi:sugar transferase (PEP-CTERM/EpsH1 system associated)
MVHRLERRKPRTLCPASHGNACGFSGYAERLTRPEILYLSHCVPYPPDKGEKIRAYHQLKDLSERFALHLVCFARNRADVEAANSLAPLCASVFVQPLSSYGALAKAAVLFLAGSCLNTSFYSHSKVRRRVRELQATRPIAAALAYSAVMFPYVTPGTSCVLDMVDVDSEKWFNYATLRRPAFPYRLEARRFRRAEVEFAEKAALSLFTTGAEEALFRRFSPSSVSTGVIENGVDFDYFDPAQSSMAEELKGRTALVFTGAMDYHPNIDAVCWFAASMLPELRRKDATLEFVIVGRNPAKQVLALQSTPGVRVIGAVPDVRPYVNAATAIVAPLRIARGIQNKVLEGLAMGKPACVSPTVAKTFGAQLPLGVISCDSAADYLAAIASASATQAAGLRQAARSRFTWAVNNAALVDALAKIAR